MYEQAVQKIRYQLESQGFTNIADFSKDGDQSYFMEDTIHICLLYTSLNFSFL